MFFMRGWLWANPRLYRSAALRERLLQLRHVEMAVAHQFTVQQQDRYFVPVARPLRRIGIDVADLERQAGDALERSQIEEKLLAQRALRPREQEQPGGRAAWRHGQRRALAVLSSFTE